MTETQQGFPREVTAYRRTGNVQPGKPTLKDAIAAYKKGLSEESQHTITIKGENGQKTEISCSASGLNKEQFYESVQNSVSGFDESDIYPTVEKLLIFTGNNSEAFCGLKPEGFYKTKKEQEFTINGAAKELTKMISILIKNDYKDIVLPEQLKSIFSGIKEPTREDLLKATRSGIKIAEKCHACEQVDPMVGAMVHSASTILARVTPWEHAFANFWEDTYPGTIDELSNPKKTGIVDVLIVMTEKNKDKFPNMDKFFGSHLEIEGENGEEGFSGTYYDMVGMDEYKAV
jgi:hypothetical protein